MLKEERPIPGRSVLLIRLKPVLFSEVYMNKQKSEQNDSIGARPLAPQKASHGKSPTER